MSFDLSHVSVKSGIFDLSLVEIRLRYLDTFSEVDILEMVGPQTIRNVVKLNRVRGELDLTVTFGAETLPLTVHMELENIDAAFSILMAVNKNVLGDIELGQLLYRENIMRCFFSSMAEVVVTELDFSASLITSFGVDGLGKYSDTLDKLTAFALDVYGVRLAQLMRPFFGTTIKAVLNNWFEYMVSKRFEKGCPLSSLTSQDRASVDFRDLLLTRAKAVEYGGSGLLPYGDLFEWAIGIIKENLCK